VGGILQSWQSTLAKAVRLEGIGIHSGMPVSLTLHPAPTDAGIIFQHKGSSELIPAVLPRLAGTELAVAVGDKNGMCVSTIEHVMAALSALGVDNALVEIVGSEVPILDGSAAPYVDAIDDAGIVTQSAPRRFIEVLKPVRIDNGSQWAELLPYDGFKLDIDIDFEHGAISRQRLILDITPHSFRNEIASARTFGFMQDAERLRAAGYGLGASFDNTVVLGDEGILNKEGLRYADEFVRHKALDAVGDLALAGLPLRALYHSYRGGHKLNAGILNALLIDRAAFRIVELSAPISRPVRASVGLRVAAPTYTPAR
jgi:UDP-3-O-[3-hydroxymyristoyl] N-acetylglucosamine deacetylase